MSPGEHDTSQGSDAQATPAFTASYRFSLYPVSVYRIKSSSSVYRVGALAARRIGVLSATHIRASLASPS